MTGQAAPDPAEVDALWTLLARLRYGSHTYTSHEMAEHILASDWLAAHDAAVAAAARREGAAAVVAAVEAAFPSGSYYDWMREKAVTAARAAASALDDPQTEPPSTHPESCWCYGTGWRNDLDVPCNLPADPQHREGEKP